MTNERQLKTTNGYFDVVGEIVIDAKTFVLGQAGKNNSNWMQNVFNPKITCTDGQSMYMRFSSGYDVVAGKTIYARSTSDTNLKISFADRHNDNILKVVNDKSFIRVGIKKELVKDEATGKEFKRWVYKTFLDSFDVIEFLQTILEPATKHKVRITGGIRFSTYNNEVQRNYDLQSIYLLDGNEDDNVLESKLEFTQNVLIKSDSIVDDIDGESGVATVNSLVMVKEKGEFKTIPVKLLMKPKNDKQKKAYKMIIKNFLTVPEDKVRRINLECKFESGYISNQVTEADLEQEAIDLLEGEIYTMEEILKMYAVKERVDNLLLRRPKMKIIDNLPRIEASDDEYLLSDLDGIGADIDQEEMIETDIAVTDLLNDLQDL